MLKGTRPEVKREAEQLLLHLAQDAELSLEQRINAARALSYHDTGPEAKREAEQLLLHLAQDVELSLEQRINAAQALSYHDTGPEAKREAKQLLFDIMQNSNLKDDQRLKAAERYIKAGGDGTSNSIDPVRVQAIILAFDLLKNDNMSQYFEKHWLPHGRFYYMEIDVKDLPHLITFVQQDMLPINVRNNIYEVLTQSIPQFDKIQDNT